MNATETLNRVLATLGLKPEASIEVDLAQVKTEDGQATFESDNFAVWVKRYLLSLPMVTSHAQKVNLH